MIKFRKIALFVSTIACFVGAGGFGAKAQSYYIDDNRTFYGGLIAGATFTQVDGDNFAGYHKVGFTGGGIAYAELAPKFAASIEILYTQKGSRAHKTQTSNNKVFFIEKYDIDLSYAEVPILFNYFDKRKSHFGAGVSYSQLISYKENVGTQPAFPDSVNLDQYPFRKYDINFILSGNLHVYKGFFLNARFQYSLLPIRNKIYPEFGRAEQYNNMWVIRLMYLFQ
ncbi:MAG: PorT family protein [Chitinophagales bacterium]|nr:PorT family protein [Chitinophagaceae bacterium]MCB9064703.1 PorT family protein [Chitinophagales bacterium]